MRIPSFYSPWRGIGVEDAWHDNDQCPIGQSIDPAHRIRGKKHAHCRFCALLDVPLPNSKPQAGQQPALPVPGIGFQA